MRLTILSLLATLGLAPFVAAQDGKDKEKVPKWRIDPYTRNEPEALKKAGYVGFGPFPFGNIADTPVMSTEIDDKLEFVQILWIETPHFRIGCNLPDWAVPLDPPTRAKIRGELEELQQKLPRVNPKMRVLDPWIRAHLIAHRCEKFYAETQKLFGVTDADFPTDPSKVYPQPGARFMGYGPYLGMRDKYLVLLIEKAGPYETYLKTFVGKDQDTALRWHFKETSSYLTTFPIDHKDFSRKHDTGLHCELVFNLGQVLLDGFRSYSYNLPVWMREGFGHWNSRRISPDWPSFTGDEGGHPDIKVNPRWDLLTRQYIAQGKVTKFAEVATWRSYGDLKFPDHVAAWSRIDWLISQGPEKWQKFLFHVKGRVDEKWMPDHNDLVGAVRDGLQQAYGVSMLDIDTKWADWVKATYATQ